MWSSYLVGEKMISAWLSSLSFVCVFYHADVPAADVNREIRMRAQETCLLVYVEFAGTRRRVRWAQTGPDMTRDVRC